MMDEDRTLENLSNPTPLVGRQVLQRLESLRRAGIDHLPSPPFQAIEISETVSPIQQPATNRRELSASEPIEPPVSFPTPLADGESLTVKRSSGPKSAPKAAQPPTTVTGSSSLFGETGFETPVMPVSERAAELLKIAKVVSGCTKCPILAATRTQTVFGDGSPSARLMFIGEAPGADEDRLGVPFVGRAGQLLTDMITKGMGLGRDEVYIANILKCRPPGNRDPQLDECANCMPYLEQQLEIVRPEFLCLLGRIASQNLLQTTVAMGKLRGRWHSVRGIKTLVTYHPAYLLRNPPAKKDAWEDLQLIMKAMGLPIPSRKKE